MTARELKAADKLDALDIWLKGYSPIPLPRGQKHPPLEGWTGEGAPMASRADVQSWLDAGDYGNVAVRLPVGVIGVDVDAYGDKAGWSTWCELTAQSWPATHVVTARDGGKSGIRLFRLPEGFDESELWGSRKGVDIIKHTHRYIMGPGSLHPDVDAIVGVIDERTGDIGLELPHAEDLPVLTAEQAAQLCKPEWDWTQPARESGTCSHVALALTRGITALAKAAQGGRYDAMTGSVWELVNLDHEGHRGSELALEQLALAYLDAIRKAPRGGETPADVRQEYARNVADARAKMTGPAQHLCTEGAVALAEPEPEVDDSCPKLPESFWTQRDSLQHVRQAARSRTLGPDGVLLTCLVRVATSLDPSIVLPPHVGGIGSTNLFGALVMGSGGGKTAAKSVAAELVPLPSPLAMDAPEDEEGGHRNRGTVKTITMGSPEGVVAAFGRMEGGTGGRKRTWVKDEWALLIDSDEVDAFMGQASYGSGTTPMLRSAWSGQALGATLKNAPTDVAAHDYRLGLLIGAQPERCAALLTGKEAHGGTPQRFVWLSAQTDADLTLDTIPDWPGALDWEQWPPTGSLPMGTFHAELTNTHGDPMKLYGIKMPEALIRQIKQHQLEQSQGRAGAMDGHRNQLRLRVALALGMLDRGSKYPQIKQEDWQLAGVVMDTSDAVREWIAERADAAELAEVTGKVNQRKRADVDIERQIERVAAKVMRALIKHGGMTRRQLTHDATDKRDRDYLDQALMRLREGGQVVVRDGRWLARSEPNGGD